MLSFVYFEKFYCLSHSLEIMSKCVFSICTKLFYFLRVSLETLENNVEYFRNLIAHSIFDMSLVATNICVKKLIYGGGGRICFDAVL